MTPLSYSGCRFPADVIQRAVWMHPRFTLNYRDIEELLAESRLNISHDTIRWWILTSGPVIARRSASVVVALPCRSWPTARPSRNDDRVYYYTLRLNTYAAALPSSSH